MSLRKTEKTEIVKTTAELINILGKEKIGIRDIGDKCNVGTSSLYNYFDSYYEILSHVREYTSQEILEIISNKNDIYKLLESLISYSSNNQNVWKLLFESDSKIIELESTSKNKKKLFDTIGTVIGDHLQIKKSEDLSVNINALVIGLINLDLNNNLQLLSNKSPAILIENIINKYLKG